MREVVILRLYSPASFVKDELHWTDVRQGDGSWKSSLMFPRWSDMVYHGEPCPKKRSRAKQLQGCLWRAQVCVMCGRICRRRRCLVHSDVRKNTRTRIDIYLSGVVGGADRL